SLLTFFGGAAVGRVVYQDEVEWGAKGIDGLNLPTSLQAFEAFIRSRPHEFLTRPRSYAWPSISMALCAGCLALVYRELRRTHMAPFDRRRRLAMTSAFLAYGGVAGVFALLDRVVRINW